MSFVNRLSIRTRITVGTLLLAALFFSGTGLVVEGQVERILLSASQEILRTDAAPYEAALQREPGEGLDRPGEGQLVAVLDAHGQIAVSSLPRPLAAMITELTNLSTHATPVTAGGVDYLVRTEAVSTATGNWVIVTARTQAAQQLIIMGLRQGLVIGLGLLTLVLAAASWLLVGAALRPVTGMRTSAERLLETRSDELLPVGPAVDEVSALAVTLNRLINDLRTSAERERQLVSDASHELRTPLAIVQAQLELLRTGDRSAIDDDLRSAELATQRLSTLVSSLLELSRLEASGDAASSTPDELADALTEAVDRCRLLAAGRGATVDFSISPTGAGTVALFAHDFGRVVDNLVNNSIFAGADSVIVSLSRDGSALLLEVVDTGPGIPADFLPRAFDRFSRSDAARSSAPGSGLGLSIVAAAVHSAGGTITLAGRLPHGTIAVVRLPLAP